LITDCKLLSNAGLQPSGTAEDGRDDVAPYADKSVDVSSLRSPAFVSEPGQRPQLRIGTSAPRMNATHHRLILQTAELDDQIVDDRRESRIANDDAQKVRDGSKVPSFVH
jgi:hypothetical protein